MDSKIIGDRLRALMQIRHVRRIDLAEELGMSYNTLTQKLIGRREFGLNDMLKIKDVFDLDNELCAAIFFDEDFLLSKLE